jgi:hypothetical protein
MLRHEKKQSKTNAALKIELFSIPLVSAFEIPIHGPNAEQKLTVTKLTLYLNIHRSFELVLRLAGSLVPSFIPYEHFCTTIINSHRATRPPDFPQGRGNAETRYRVPSRRSCHHQKRRLSPTLRGCDDHLPGSYNVPSCQYSD